ncbi:DNA topoisomerase IB, partial [Singulisphaera rosea]
MVTTTLNRRKARTSIDDACLDSAKVAGMRDMTDDRPGIRRRRCGKGFVYLDTEGRRIQDRQLNDRIASLA